MSFVKRKEHTARQPLLSSDAALAKLASGLLGRSREDRILAGAVARPFASGELAWEEDEAHGAALLRGMPVLWYNPNEMTFEHRVIKVDKGCAVLLIIAHEGTVSNGTAKEDVVGVRISSICSIWEMAEALRICHFLSITDSHLNAETAIVVQASNRSWRNLKPEDVHIFLQAPRQRLKVHMEACLARRSPADGGLSLFGDTAAPLGLLATTRQAVHVDGFRVNDNLKAFDQDLDDVVFEITQVTPSKTSEWALPGHTYPSAVDNELLKLVERLGPVAHIDHARMSMVVHEVAALRQWLGVLADHDHLDLDLRKILENKQLLNAMVMRNNGFEAALKHVEALLEDHRERVGFELNGSAAVRTVALPLKRFLDLEIRYKDLAHRLSTFGLPLPDCMTLSGVLVEPEDAEPEAPAPAPQRDIAIKKPAPLPPPEVAKRKLNLDRLPDKARYGLIDMPDSSRSILLSARSLLSG